jgi:RNA-directed DNA polymerase
MNGNEESDPIVVAIRTNAAGMRRGKPTNKAGRPVAEPVERRVGTKGNASQHNTRRAQNRESVTQALDRVRQAARTRKKERFTALLHPSTLICFVQRSSRFNSMPRREWTG